MSWTNCIYIVLCLLPIIYIFFLSEQQSVNIIINLLWERRKIAVNHYFVSQYKVKEIIKDSELK